MNCISSIGFSDAKTPGDVSSSSEETETWEIGPIKFFGLLDNLDSRCVRSWLRRAHQLNYGDAWYWRMWVFQAGRRLLDWDLVKCWCTMKPILSSLQNVYICDPPLTQYIYHFDCYQYYYCWLWIHPGAPLKTGSPPGLGYWNMPPMRPQDLIDPPRLHALNETVSCLWGKHVSISDCPNKVHILWCHTRDAMSQTT